MLFTRATRPRHEKQLRSVTGKEPNVPLRQRRCSLHQPRRPTSRHYRQRCSVSAVRACMTRLILATGSTTGSNQITRPRQVKQKAQRWQAGVSECRGEKLTLTPLINTELFFDVRGPFPAAARRNDSLYGVYSKRDLFRVLVGCDT